MTSDRARKLPLIEHGGAAAALKTINKFVSTKTNRTFIVRYRSIPLLLFITETSKLLPRLFIGKYVFFLFFFFVSYTSNKSDMTGLDVPGIGERTTTKQRINNRAIE